MKPNHSTTLVTLPSSSLYSLRPPLACGNPSSISSWAAFSGLRRADRARGVAGGVAAQVGDRDAQALDQDIEDLLEERAMRLLAEHFLEPRDVPRLGHAGFRLDADEPAQALVAAQFGEHGLGGDVPQRDPQDDDAPEDGHGVVVAALAPSGTERVEQLAIGEGGEQILDGLQRGTVFEGVPGEQRLGGVDDHHGRLTRGFARRDTEPTMITTQ